MAVRNSRAMTAGLWSLVCVLASGTAARAADDESSSQVTLAAATVDGQEAPVAPAPPMVPAPVAPEAPAIAPPGVEQPGAQLPSPSVPAAESTTTKTMTAAPAPFPIGFTAMFSQSLGEGTFAARRYVRNPYYAWWASVRPRLTLPFGFGAQLRQDVDMEWTHTDANTFDYQPLLSDTRMSASYSGLKSELLGLGLVVFGGARAPISLESRFRRQLTTLDLGAAVNFNKWGIQLGLSATGAAHVRMPGKPMVDDGPLGWWFNTSSASRPYQDRSGQFIPTQKCIARASEAAAGACPVTGAANGNIAQAFISLSAGYDFATLLSVPVSISASMVTIHALSAYVGPNDGLKAENARSGPRLNTFTWGQVSLAWQMFDWMSLDVGINSMQPLLNATNQYVRFPFWNIPYWDLKRLGYYSGANNFSSLTTGVTITL